MKISPTIVGICAAIAIVGTIVTVGNSFPAPYERETDTSGYKLADDLLYTCPSLKNTLKDLIDNDGVLTGMELSKFHKLCEHNRRDARKKILMDRL